jgi:hypothetical protein
MQPNNNTSCGIWLPWFSGLCIPDQPNHSFQPYAVFIEDTNSRTEGRCSDLFWKEANEI